jgi:hypothetical protein
MGGEIRVAARFGDRSLRSGTGWTSIIPGLVLNERFLDLDEDYLRSILDEWDEGDEEGLPPLAPYGYGIVVVDVPSRTVVTCNDYSALVEAPIQPRFLIENGLRDEDGDNGDRLLARMLDERRLSILRKPFPAYADDGRAPIREVLECGPDGLDAMVEAHYARMPYDRTLWDMFVYDLRPWTVSRVYPDKLVPTFERLGLPVTEADRAAIQAFLDGDQGEDED